MNVAGVFLGAAMFYILSEMIGGAASARLASYGGSYFPFVLIGVAFLSYLKLSMDSMASSLRNEQLLGTLEAVTATPTSLTAFAAGSALWQFAFATYRVFMYLFFGAVFFGLSLAGMNVLTALVVLILSVAAFAGMGVISGSLFSFTSRGIRSGGSTEVLLSFSEGLLPSLGPPRMAETALCHLSDNALAGGDEAGSDKRGDLLRRRDAAADTPRFLSGEHTAGSGVFPLGTPPNPKRRHPRPPLTGMLYNIHTNFLRTLSIEILGYS